MREGRRSAWFRRFRPFGPVLLACLLVAFTAWARAGGGEHYSGGRSSGSHGGGGGGDGVDIGEVIELVWFLVRMTVDYPYVMGPVWIGVIALLWWWSRQPSGPAGPIRRLERERRAYPPPGPSLAALQQRDPEFAVPAFQQRTKHVFHEIQEAWFLRQLGRARQFMSDGLYRRFATLQTMMTLEGRRDAVADDKVLSTRIVTAASTDAFDILTVRVEASIRDTEVPSEMPDDRARQKALGVRPELFVELWTFVRRPTAKTREGFDLGQGKCPNCGAPFTGGMANTCEYCKAIVNSGNYDWVLTEITQEEEFLPPARPAPGLDLLRARDANAAPEVLEDRALLLFWKWLAAFAENDPKGLRKVARPEMFDAVSAQLKRFRQSGETPVVKVPAVGGADLVAVEADSGGFDRVHVDVRWSGVVSITPGSALGRLAKRPLRHVVTMVRKTGVPSDAGTGLSTERCGNCSAPLTDADAPTCEYCGSDLTSAAKDWVLESVVPYEAWRRPESAAHAGAPRAFATSSERTRLLQTLTALAKADGLVTDDERRLLRDCAKRWGVPWNQVALMLEGEANLPVDDVRQLSPDQARVVLAEMVRMVKLDGRIHRRERELLGEAATHMGVPVQELERLLQG